MSIIQTASSTPVARTIPVHFGASERPLFGCLHWPTHAWSGARVVLCAPLGYEGQFSYRTFRELAIHLAESGTAVLRFDYDGCGDSAGSDEDPGRVQSWIASIGLALDQIQRMAVSDGPVVLIGMRAGALLAAAVAAARRDVTALVLWAPSRSGRLFLREQRAFSGMAVATATAAGASKERWGERGFEANGYVFTDETVGALEQLDLKNLATSPAPQVLVLDRAEMPGKSSAPDSWHASGAQVEQQLTPGYRELMEPPWLSQRPIEAFAKIGEWICALPRARNAANDRAPQPLSSAARVQPNATECATWIDADQQRFGILTEPDGNSRRHALILITSTFGFRIGPNRMNVAAAREFAGLGIATLRIDLAGVGEVRETPPLSMTKPPNTPYHLDAIEDVRLAVQYLKRRGYEHIALGGICAGAFLAWHAALVSGGVSQIVLINPETFVPIPFDLQDHLKAGQAAPKWSERFRSETRLAGKVRLLLERAARVVAIGMQVVRARLPLFLNRSLAAKIHALGMQRTRTSIIFSDGDSGIVEFRRDIGSSAHRFERRGFLTRIDIKGPDHSFTPRWANRLLIEAVAAKLKGWLRHTGADDAQPNRGANPLPEGRTT